MSDATTDMSLQESCKEAMTHMSVEVKLLIDKVNELEAKNAKLQETLQRRTEQFEGMTEMWVERGVENAKLRELVDYMTPIAWYAASERERDRMREMGIEVTEGAK